MVFTIVVYDKSDTQFSDAFSILVNVKDSFGYLTVKERSILNATPAERLIKDLSENMDNALYNLRYIIYKEYSTNIFEVPTTPGIEYETERWAVQGSLNFFKTILNKILGHYTLNGITSGTKLVMQDDYEKLTGHHLNICTYRIISTTVVQHSYVSAIDISNRIVTDPLTSFQLSHEDIKHYKLRRTNTRFVNEEKLVMLVERGDNVIKCGKLRIADKFGYDFRCAVDPTFADTVYTEKLYNKQISTQKLMTTLTSLSGRDIWTNPYVTELTTYV